MRSRLASLFSLCILSGFAASAWAGSVSNTVPVAKASPLRVITTGVTADCTWPSGTVVLQMSTTGGNGQPVTYSLGGTPSGDFVISGTNLVVGPTGVAPANCGKVENVTINANQ